MRESTRREIAVNFGCECSTATGGSSDQYKVILRSLLVSGTSDVVFFFEAQELRYNISELEGGLREDPVSKRKP